MKACILFILTLFISTGVWADVVITSSAVDVSVVVREGPARNSNIIGYLAPEEFVQYDGMVDRWRRIKLKNGKTGYVSAGWTDIVPGSGLELGDINLSLVDVGTGLALVVSGDDFIVLYDGGSYDDILPEGDNRLLLYLKKNFPNLSSINHIIASHPRRAHINFLPDVIKQYAVNHVWDSGVNNGTCTQRTFLNAINDKQDLIYHSPLTNFGKAKFRWGLRACDKSTGVTLRAGARVSEDWIELGVGARMRFLLSSQIPMASINDNSLIVQFELNKSRVLVMGDGGAGRRSNPNSGLKKHTAERVLIECCAKAIKSDVLVVGHHGSKASSRAYFLDRVQAQGYPI